MNCSHFKVENTEQKRKKNHGEFFLGGIYVLTGFLIEN